MKETLNHMWLCKVKIVGHSDIFPRLDATKSWHCLGCLKLALPPTMIAHEIQLSFYRTHKLGNRYLDFRLQWQSCTDLFRDSILQNPHLRLHNAKVHPKRHNFTLDNPAQALGTPLPDFSIFLLLALSPSASLSF